MKRFPLLSRLGFVLRMKYFSAMHRLHLFVTAECGCTLSIISHDKRYSVFDSFSFNMNSLKVVAVFLWLSLKLDVCDFELIFCYSNVSILLFQGFLFDSCSVYHSLLKALAFVWAGFFIPEIASFSLFLFIFVDSRTVLLWLEIICFIFCMQL